MDLDPEMGPALKRLYNNLFLLLGVGTVFFCGVLLYAILGHTFNFSANTPTAKKPMASLQAQSEPQAASESEDIVDGIHVPSGLVVAEGFETVLAQCTACHSGKLVAQNRASRNGWEEMIRWMQKTQGLWPLGENEPVILDYLAANYGPQEAGRRPNLEDVEWYILELPE